MADGDVVLAGMSTFMARSFFAVIRRLGALAASEDDFVQYMTRELEAGTHEFRFQGVLGFGGKAYWDGQRAWVSCYSEDLTPERCALIDVTNAWLEEKFS